MTVCEASLRIMTVCEASLRIMTVCEASLRIMTVCEASLRDNRDYIFAARLSVIIVIAGLDEHVGTISQVITSQVLTRDIQCPLTYASRDHRQIVRALIVVG